MAADKDPVPDTKEMLLTAIFMVVDKLIKVKKLKQALSVVEEPPKK